MSPRVNPSWRMRECKHTYTYTCTQVFAREITGETSRKVLTSFRYRRVCRSTHVKSSEEQSAEIAISLYAAYVDRFKSSCATLEISILSRDGTAFPNRARPPSDLTFQSLPFGDRRLPCGFVIRKMDLFIRDIFRILIVVQCWDSTC